MKSFIVLLKIVCSKIVGILLWITQLFIRVRSNQAVFISFSGKNFDSNPKYFSEYLRLHKKNIHAIWAFKSIPNVAAKQYKQVRYGSIRYFFYGNGEDCRAQMPV